ncbi:MAG: DUF815 domain-containing protein [Butyricicoccaceae bacterium]
MPVTTARRATASSRSPRRSAMQDDGSATPDRASRCHPPARPAWLRDARRSRCSKYTLAFLDGTMRNNILLYGDKGTGKSSTVKAVANEYADRGLKIIEMSPRQITYFPKLFEQTLRSPFRFHRIPRRPDL